MPKKAEMETTKTFQALTSDQGSVSRSAFTLIEVMLVMVLLAYATTAIMPDISTIFRVGVKSSVRRYTALVRFAYDEAMLSGKVHRIVIDLDKQTWKLERAQDGMLPVDKERAGVMMQGFRNEDRVNPEPTYKTVGARVVEKIPSGTRINAIKTWRKGEELITKGEVAIDAFPSGLIDESSVEISEEGQEKVQKFIISVAGLTGKTQIKVENEGR
jgi:prepilin-type N-terminal cleavage/methylation domain-containing protein